MSLTRDEFKASLLSFYDQQKNIQLNEWNWETVPVSSAVYLRKTNYLQANLEESEEDEPIEIFIKVEYHVAYSISYRVPTLYFQPSYYQDGSPLSLQDIYKYVVPKSYHQDLKNHHYIPCISQTEHPLLSTPFWYIHPCETSTLMKVIAHDQENYIKTWLSFIGPVVQCNVPKELFQ